MKVISLLQPWATLVVIGAKKIETRSWNTKFRGEILIHASRKFAKNQIELGQELNRKYGVGLGHVDDLPTGAIIGKVNVIDTFQFDEQTKESLVYYYDHEYKIGWELNEQELTFGDYSGGRYGWLLSDPIQFTEPIPAKGSLSIWNYDKRVCLKCGCTEENACDSKEFGPCWWVNDETDICSHCLKGVKDIV
jgi:activating signal cointegrator 1